MSTAEKSNMHQDLSNLDPQKLHRLFSERQMDFGKASLELQRRRSQGRIHVPAEEAPLSKWDSGNLTIISPELGFDVYNFHVFFIARKPKTEEGLYHTHGDAVKYYVRGRGYELIGDKTFEVKAGDFLHVPANIWHGTQNPYDEPLCFLAAQQYPGTFRQTPTPFIWRDGSPNVASVRELTDKDIGNLEPKLLYQVYMKAQMEFAEVLNEVQRRRGQRRIHIRGEDVPLNDRRPGEHVILGPELGFDIYTFSLSLVHVPPGEKYRHNHGEAVKYYLSGRGREMVDDQEYEAKAGDFIFNPANARNATVNSGDEPIRFLLWQQIAGTFRQVITPLRNID